MLQFYFDPTDQAEQAAFELDAVAIAREVANRTNSTAELAGVLDAIQSEVRCVSCMPAKGRWGASGRYAAAAH